jgi:hypothetical protein
VLGSISHSGAVKGAGVLGDGTKFAFSAPLLADATCPVFAQPYAKQGLLAGTSSENNGSRHFLISWTAQA